MARGLLSKCPKLTEIITSRFFKTFYWLNTIQILSYFIIRPFFKESLVFNKREMASFFLTREEQIFGILVFTFLLKSRYLVTLDMVLGHIYGYFQVGLLVTTLGVDYYWFAGNCFIGLVLFFIPQPEYEGPQKITLLGQDSFEKKVERAPPTESWLVLFYTTWAYDCKQIAPNFADLSLRYGSQYMKFGKLNMTYASHVALKYNISIRSNTQQLPTLILFQHGKEVCRTPSYDRETDQVTKMVLSLKNVLELFDLETLSKRPPKKPETLKS